MLFIITIYLSQPQMVTYSENDYSLLEQVFDKFLNMFINTSDGYN